MAALVTFGVLADCQYADHDPSREVSPDGRHVHHNRYRATLEKLRRAVDDFNSWELDFVVHLGDLVDRRLEDFDVLESIFAGSSVPVWQVLGNHDFSGSAGREESVLRKFGLESGHYSHRFDGFRFVILDTNDLGTIKHREGSPGWVHGVDLADAIANSGSKNGYGWNGGVGPAQLQWFRDELADAEMRNERVVVFSHHPVHPYTAFSCLNHHEIVAVIDRFPNIVAYINGHNHFGACGVRRGIPYISVPGMVEGSDAAYGIVEISSRAVRIHGYGRVYDMDFEVGAQ